MAVFKVGLTVTVLADAESEDELIAKMSNMSLDQIFYEIDDGDWLGTHKIESVDAVAPQDVGEECEAVGGEANFFEQQGREDDRPA